MNTTLQSIIRATRAIRNDWAQFHLPQNYNHNSFIFRVYRRGIKTLLMLPASVMATYNFIFSLNSPNIDFVVTPRCTLRCKDCANLMQYYKDPVDCDISVMLEDAKKLTDVFDKIRGIMLIGGEPFMHKDLHLLCRYFCENKKVLRVCVITNGTLIPSEETLKALAHKKVTVLISGYEIAKTRADKLISVLKERSIPYQYTPIHEWRDMGGVEYRGRSFPEAAQVFSHCMGMCNTFFEGEYHLCARSAHGTHLGFIKRSANDFVNIRGLQKDEARRQLHRLLYQTKCIEACQHCDNSSIQNKPISAAVQMNNSIQQETSNNVHHP